MRRLTLALATLALALVARGAEAQGYVLVVNEGNPASAMSKAEVANVFLKKSSKLVPVDLAKESPARESFSRAVLGRSATAVASYWQQQIFAGRDVPPVEKASDAEVLAFVRANVRAVGYVSAGASLGDGVKAVALR